MCVHVCAYTCMGPVTTVVLKENKKSEGVRSIPVVVEVPRVRVWESVHR